MTRQRLKLIIRIATVLFWAVFWWKTWHVFVQSGLTFRHIPFALRGIILQAGVLGPTIVLTAFVLRTFLLIPSSVLELVAGSVYGPVWGTALNLIGVNLTACLAFVMGRFLGRDFLSKHENALMRSYDEAMTRDGFSAVLAMRLLFVPFDVVNYGAGLTGIKFRSYATATFLGLFPSVVAFTVMGNSIGKPESFLTFIGLSAFIVALVLFVKGHPWIRSALSRNTRAEPHD